MEKRCSFELFKSNVCHWLKEEGDIDFLIQVLESDLILKYYRRQEQKLVYFALFKVSSAKDKTKYIEELKQIAAKKTA